MDYTPVDPLIGSSVAQYDIVAKIGGGGMGVVYKATDTKLGRVVALKFLPPQWSHDESAKQRFLREAQAASATNHPNICVIHDIEESTDGRLFIVMAYYEGQTLKQRLEGGALPLYEALDIAYGVALGLAKAHAQRVVHRDIKPGNLIVTDDGVKIVDFGLATFADAVRLTIEGSTIGTVAYMSPEQARGEEADARSDIWALGVVLYEMLTGEPPFKGAYPEAVFYAIKNEPIPPMRVAAGEMTERLEALILRALERDPGKRYQSAREMARDLRLLQGLTLPVDLLGSPFPLARSSLPWWRRMGAAVTWTRAAGAAAVLVAAVAASSWWLTRPVARIAVAIAPVANHTGEPELDPYGLALTESLIEDLRESPNLHVVPFLHLVEILRPFLSGAAEPSSREAIQTISNRSGARVIVMPTLVRRDNRLLAQAEFRSLDGGTSLATIETEAEVTSLPKETAYRLMVPLSNRIQGFFGPGGRLDALLSALGISAGLRQSLHLRLYGPIAPRGPRTLDAVRRFASGLDAYDRQEYAAALTEFRQAAEADSQHALTQVWLSRVSLILSLGNEAVAAGQRAQGLAAADVQRAVAAFAEGVLAESRSDFGTAEARYREAAVRQPDDPAALVEVADFLKRQNRDLEAIAAYREVLRSAPGYIRPHVELCQLYARTDEYPLADEEARDALEKYRAAGNQVGEAHALLALSELRRRQRRVEDARQAAQSALKIFQQNGLEYGLARAYQYLGTIAGIAGDTEAAIGLFQEALTRSRRVGNRQLEALELQNLGFAHEALGHVAEALAFYELSRPLFETINDERRAAELAVTAANLMVTYGTGQDEALGRLASARATLQKLHNVLFDVLAIQVQAESELYAGRHEGARTQLRSALSQARERHLSEQVASSTIDLARSYFLLNEYDAARTTLEQLVASPDGRDDVDARITLGRTYVRLGDFAAATDHLTRGLPATEARGEKALAPFALVSLGELAYESGRQEDARSYFRRAAALGAVDLPDAASVEATCYLGSIDRGGNARERVTAAVNHARRMRRLYLEAKCRFSLAGIELEGRRYAEGIAILDQIPKQGVSLGPELQAEALYWRGQALSGRGDGVAAQAASTQARSELRGLQEKLPAAYRERFAGRLTIRRVFEEKSVQKRQ